MPSEKVDATSYVTYFDEVKSETIEGKNSGHYIFAGFCYPIEKIGQLETKINLIVDKFLPQNANLRDSEIKGKDIYHNKGAFRSLKLEERVELFVSLLRILSDDQDIKRVYSLIHAHLRPKLKSVDDYAFAFFCERVQLAIGRNGSTLLIADLDDSKASATIKQFLDFKKFSTPLEYGRKITCVMDTIYFTRSHHSRLIQLADVYAYFIKWRQRTTKNRIDELIQSETKELNLYAHRYKEWPLT